LNIGIPAETEWVEFKAMKRNYDFNRGYEPESSESYSIGSMK